MLRGMLRQVARRVGALFDPIAPEPPDPASSGSPILSGATDYGEWSIATPRATAAATDPVVQAASVQAASSGDEDENTRLRRQNAEYWSALQRFEEQRDRWRKFFTEKTAGYQSHIGHLTDMLAHDRQLLVRALATINQMRKEKGQPPIDSKIYDEALAKLDWQRPEYQLARTYYEDLRRIHESAPTPLRRADLPSPVALTSTTP